MKGLNLDELIRARDLMKENFKDYRGHNFNGAREMIHIIGQPFTYKIQKTKCQRLEFKKLQTKALVSGINPRGMTAEEIKRAIRNAKVGQ